MCSRGRCSLRRNRSWQPHSRQLNASGATAPGGLRMAADLLPPARFIPREFHLKDIVGFLGLAQFLLNLLQSGTD